MVRGADDWNSGFGRSREAHESTIMRVVCRKAVVTLLFVRVQGCVAAAR